MQDGKGVDEWGGFDIRSESKVVLNSGQSLETPKTTPESSKTTSEVSDASEVVKVTQEGTQTPEGASEHPRLKKRAKKPLSKREKVVRVMLRRAGLEKLPPLEQIMRCKAGQKMSICDIGLFVGDPADASFGEIAEKCRVPNRVNLSAMVTRNRVITVGADILKKGRMFQPIQVARIEEDGALECTSGRHRLAFLAMAYGPDVEIPVYIEDMTLNEARDAVVVANQARPTKVLERAEHAVMNAVRGNLDAKQEELYEKTITTKRGFKKYCTYSVIDRNYPIALGFAISSRKDGGLTTLSNVENFWSTSLNWNKEMSCKDFDATLKQSIVFLNSLVKSMQKQKGFNPSHHLASRVMSAIGKYYRGYEEITGKNAMDVVESVSETLVKLGEVSNYRYDEIYNMLTKALRV